MLTEPIHAHEKCDLAHALKFAAVMAGYTNLASHLACIGTPEADLQEKFRSVMDRMQKTFRETSTDIDKLTWGDVRAMWLRVCKQIVLVLEEEG